MDKKKSKTKKYTDWKAVCRDLIEDGHIVQEVLECYIHAHTKRVKRK